jgi:hypothetical protein
MNLAPGIAEDTVEAISHDRSHRDLRRKSYQDLIPTAPAATAGTSKTKERKRKRRKSSTSSISEGESGSDFAPDKESDYEDDEEEDDDLEGKNPLIDDDDLVTDDIDEKDAAVQKGQVVEIQDDGNEALFQVLYCSRSAFCTHPRFLWEIDILIH